VHEFDLATRSYTGQRWRYRVARPDLLVADFTALDEHRFVALERDNFQGTAARHKRTFVVDLRETAPDGTLVKQPVADLLDIADPDGLSLPGRLGDLGLGDAFAMPYVTIEKVRAVLHAGDIKNGSSLCSDERFLALRTLYDTFKDPFVYTPGDNEWTDCHRAAAGGYLPTERLAKVRELFFPTPGTTTIGGRALRVASQPELVENSLWRELAGRLLDAARGGLQQ